MDTGAKSSTGYSKTLDGSANVTRRVGLLLLLVLRFELRHYRWVRQGRRVAERSPLGDVAQQPTHDLAASRLGQLGREDHVVRPRQRADLLRDVRLQLVHQLG